MTSGWIRSCNVLLPVTMFAGAVLSVSSFGRAAETSSAVTKHFAAPMADGDAAVDQPGRAPAAGGALGACCIPDVGCEDNDGAGMTRSECVQLSGYVVDGLLCADDPCAACAFNDPDHCQLNTGYYIFMADTNYTGGPVDDFRPQTSGAASDWCWDVCYYDPHNEVECILGPPSDNFYLSLWEDGGGVPGVELLNDSPINVVAKYPHDFLSNRCWQYSFHLPDAPVLTADECYWARLEGTGIPGACTVYTGSSADGNSYVYHDTGEGYLLRTSIADPPDPAVDSGFCSSLGVDSVSGGCGDYSGACCYGDETCSEVLTAPDCVSGGGVFLPGEACAPALCPATCANDDCTAPIHLNNPGFDCAAGLPCTVNVDNQLCDQTVIETTCSVSPGADPSPSHLFGADAWYKYTVGPGECGDMTVSMCLVDGGWGDYDAMLALYAVDGGSGCPADISEPDGCGDDTCGIGGGLAKATAFVQEGQDVYIRVGGWNGASGPAGIALSLDAVPCPAANQAARPGPNAEHLLTITNGIECTVSADCAAGSVGSVAECVTEPFDPSEGICYVPGNRWLSTKPNSDNAGTLTARRISLLLGNDPNNPDDRHVLGWVGAPAQTQLLVDEVNPQYIAQVQDKPAYLDWTAATGSRPTHVGGCEISPNNVYVIQAILDGVDTSNELYYSPPLVLHTVTKFGDIVGTGLGSNFPNDGVSLADVFALVASFQGNPVVPNWRADLDGDFGPINLSVVFTAVAGFQSGGSYTFSEPCDCTGQICP